MEHESRRRESRRQVEDQRKVYDYDLQTVTRTYLMVFFLFPPSIQAP